MRRLAWFVPTIVATAIVTYRPAAGPWRDELATWSAATRSVSQILELGRHVDGTLVPYYLFMHFWAGLFGDGPVVMRVPAMLAAIALAAVTAILATRFWGPRAGLIAGLLVAVVPAFSRYAQEARGYAFAMLFATLATLALAAALDSPAPEPPAARYSAKAFRLWGLYAALVALTGLSHLLALLIVAGHLVAILATRKWPGLVAVAAGVLVTAATVRTGLGQHDEQLDWLHRASLTTLGNLPGDLFLASIPAGAVCALAVMALKTDRPRVATLFWLGVLLPVALMFGYDRIAQPLFLARYVLFAIPLLCVLAGAALSGLRLPVALVVVLVVGLIGVPNQQGFRGSHSPYDYAAAARVVADGERPGDGIVYAPRHDWTLTDTGFAYYLGGRTPIDVLRVKTPAQDGTLWATECPDTAACLHTARRVWLVAADNIDPSYAATATNRLTNAEKEAFDPYVRVKTTRVSGFTIVLMVRYPASPLS